MWFIKVSVQRKRDNFHFCGGSVIAPDIIVTAGHCVDSTSPDTISVQGGLLDLENPPSYSQRRSVSRIVVHSNYNDVNNDIALLKLETPFDLAASEGRIGAVCLPPANYRIRGQVVVTGWGSTRMGGPGSPKLMTVSVPVQGTLVCTASGLSSYNSTTMFCAGVPGRDFLSVQRNSGLYTLVGIVSFGLGCAIFPGFYTRVPTYVPWITENVAALQS
ncbi:hypothetical protein MTO96_021421 [Rhipicephalus appendiculatus]